MVLTIISLMKQVPLPSEMRMGDDGLMDRTKAKSIINIDCQYALEAGLQMKVDNPDAKLIVCSMGPPSFEVSLKKAISLGYDEAYLLSDRKLGGSDTYATGLAISTMLKHLGFGKGLDEDFILIAGRQTSDGDTAHVPSQVAEKLGIPQATFIETAELKDGHVTAKRIIEGGYQMMSLPIPCTLSFTPTGISPRRPTLFGAVKAKDATVTIFGIDDINLSDEKIGLSGSPTIVTKITNIQSERATIKMANGHTESELVDNFVTIFQDGKNSIEVKEKSKKKDEKRPNGFENRDFRDGASGIITWAEIVNNKISRVSLELLTPALDLASKLGNDTKVITVVIGKDLGDIPKELLSYGVDEVIAIDDKRLKEYKILPFTTIFSQIIKRRNPEIVLFGATTAGRELAPRIGMRTDSGVVADCTVLEIGEYIDKDEKYIVSPILKSSKPTYGESELATILSFICPQISTARAGTFKIPKINSSKNGKITKLKPRLTKSDFVTEIIETVIGDSGKQNLFDADIIVAGGRGSVSDEMGLVQELTDALKKQGINAEWAVSRPVVDEKLAEYARQIGQTGKTVRPKVYIAIGISGAIQHIAGIKESETIIAINHNSKESIFHHADFGIVGEYEDILPELIEKVNNGFTFGIKKIK